MMRIAESRAYQGKGHVVTKWLVCVLAVVGLAWALVCASGCSSPVADDSSPQVGDVELSASSSMTEESQVVEIRLVFDQSVSIKDSVASDFTFMLNGAPVDESVISLTTRTSANALSFLLAPAADAGSPASGSYFALYESAFELSSARSDGLIPSITGATGSCLDLSESIWGTLPSGLAIDVTETVTGSEADNMLAKTVFQVTSPALVRAITWFSVDGGETLLLKHNHEFTDSDAADCAADLASVINKAGVGVNAQARGDIVDLTATSVQDGQVIVPVVVDGVGVAGGTYDHAEEDA